MRGLDSVKAWLSLILDGEHEADDIAPDGLFGANNDREKTVVEAVFFCAPRGDRRVLL